MIINVCDERGQGVALNRLAVSFINLQGISV